MAWTAPATAIAGSEACQSLRSTVSRYASSLFQVCTLPHSGQRIAMFSSLLIANWASLYTAIFVGIGFPVLGQSITKRNTRSLPPLVRYRTALMLARGALYTFPSLRVAT